jgi:hypothetical protein
MSPVTRVSLCADLLAGRQHAVLVYSTPRWENHWREHSKAFWSGLLAPLVASSGAWFFHAYPNIRTTPHPSASDFLSWWSDTQEAVGPYRAHVLLALSEPDAALRTLSDAASEIGECKNLKASFSSELLSMATVLSRSGKLCLIVPPPPFHSLYLMGYGGKS